MILFIRNAFIDLVILISSSQFSKHCHAADAKIDCNNHPRHFHRNDGEREGEKVLFFVLP